MDHRTILEQARRYLHGDGRLPDDDADLMRAAFTALLSGPARSWAPFLDLLVQEAEKDLKDITGGDATRPASLRAAGRLKGLTDARDLLRSLADRAQQDEGHQDQPEPVRPREPSRSRAVFAVTERHTPEGPRSYWTNVGKAFLNRDGSTTVKLDALPLSGTLQLRDDPDPPTPPAPGWRRALHPSGGYATPERWLHPTGAHHVEVLPDGSWFAVVQARDGKLHRTTTPTLREAVAAVEHMLVHPPCEVCGCTTGTDRCPECGSVLIPSGCEG